MVIAEQIAPACRRTLADAKAWRSRSKPEDILVVAPYNMQVRCLLEQLPAGVEVGTVDKFQGREAPVVFFSMATSTGETYLADSSFSSAETGSTSPYLARSAWRSSSPVRRYSKSRAGPSSRCAW